ncbi:hypothetical protein BGZ65_005910, partial [Modicella reniformis]
MGIKAAKALPLAVPHNYLHQGQSSGPRSSAHSQPGNQEGYDYKNMREEMVEYEVNIEEDDTQVKHEEDVQLKQEEEDDQYDREDDEQVKQEEGVQAKQEQEDVNVKQEKEEEDEEDDERIGTPRTAGARRMRPRRGQVRGARSPKNSDKRTGYIEMISRGIKSERRRDGSTRTFLKAYIYKNFNIAFDETEANFNIAVKNGVKQKIFIYMNGKATAVELLVIALTDGDKMNTNNTRLALIPRNTTTTTTTTTTMARTKTRTRIQAAAMPQPRITRTSSRAVATSTFSTTGSRAAPTPSTRRIQPRSSAAANTARSTAVKATTKTTHANAGSLRITQVKPAPTKAPSANTEAPSLRSSKRKADQIQDEKEQEETQPPGSR